MNEDEMDDDCEVTCRPGEHKCEKGKVVKMSLIQIGRGKVCEDFTFPKQGRTEIELAELALEKVKIHLASNDVTLEPDERKGEGYWKVKVGMGYSVGDVEIKYESR